MSVTRAKYEKAKNAVSAWQEKCKELEDIISELEKENSRLRSSEEKNKEIISKLHYEKILLEGKVQQLEEAKKDLQERYNELKQDYREQQRWNKKTE